MKTESVSVDSEKDIRYNNDKEELKSRNTKERQMDTEIKKAVQAADKDAPYDREAKRLLGNKHILAHILVSLIDEFKGMPAKEAEKSIEGDVYIDAIPVEPGLTNKAEGSQKSGDRIVGLNTEDGEINEGIIRYDIIFYVRMKDGVAQIIVNIEMQKDRPSEYKLLHRAVFYICRLVSSQKEREFSNSNFDEIKRVYSIWISPYMEEDYINYIHLTDEKVLGRHQTEGRLDILNIIFIGLKEELAGKEEEYRLHRLLGTLLSEKLEPKEKLAIMNEEYEIPIEQNIRKEVDNMYTMTQHIEERARQKRETQIILNMYQKNLSLEQIAEFVGIPVHEVQKVVKQERGR